MFTAIICYYFYNPRMFKLVNFLEFSVLNSDLKLRSKNVM